MSEVLLKHIRRYTTVSDEEAAVILPYFKSCRITKKQNLLTEGKICAAHYFVVSGCLRMFFVNDKGVEQTTQFALQHWWLADYHSFETRQPSDFYIQAVEHSEVMAIDADAQRELLEKFPVMEKYFRLVQQKAYAAYQLRVKYIYDLSKEERYHHFVERFPEFAQRIPQYLLASYLGFTPEYLSEIRGKRVS